MDVVTIVQIEEQHHMYESIPGDSDVTSLYWLAFILTGSEDISVGVTAEVLSDASPNLRSAVIARSVAAQQSELQLARDCYQPLKDFCRESELRAELDSMPDFFEVRDALLAIDLFGVVPLAETGS